MKGKYETVFKHSISVGGVLFQIYVMQLIFENLFKQKEN